MTALTLVLVLASAAIHATWNLWTKQIGHTARSGTLMWAFTAISSVLYAPFALALAARTGWRPDAASFGWIAGSGAIHVVYFLLLIRGYRASDLSIVYPVARGTGPLLSAAAAIAIFAERPTALSVAGALLIVLGVLALTARVPGADGGRAAAGLRYGLAVGGLIAVYTLWDGWAVKRAGIPPLLFYWGGEITRVLLFTPAAIADRGGLVKLLRAHGPRVFGVAALSPLSYILVLIALTMGAVSHIAPARELSILIGTWLGGRVLSEGERGRRLVAAAAFVAGVVALAFA